MKRRTWIAGAAAAAAGAAGLEVAKLRGAFDHRVLREESRARWDASLAALDAQGAFVHVGQSTHLLAIAGARFLTDPWFFDPSFGALSHGIGPAVPPEDVGALDAVLITHEHPDHYDRKAIDRFDKRATIVVPTWLEAEVKTLGFADVVALEEWQSVVVKDVRVTATPAVHDIHEIGFVLEGAGRSVYFAGDTRLHDALPDIAERLQPNVAILPVDGTRLGGSKDLWVMTPDDAVTAAKTLGVSIAIPSHADAYFSDLVVRWGHLASTIADAPKIFADKAVAAGLTTLAPAAGDSLALPAR